MLVEALLELPEQSYGVALTIINLRRRYSTCTLLHSKKCLFRLSTNILYTESPEATVLTVSKEEND